MTNIKRSGPRKKVFSDVRVEAGHEIYNNLKTSVLTRWKSHHEECSSGNENQSDLDENIRRNVSETGVDHDTYKEHMTKYNNIDKAIILDDAWIFYQQYEGAMQPMRDFIDFCQTAKVCVHEVLIEMRRMAELLAEPYFVMHDNVSAKAGVTDLTERPLDQLVLSQMYLPRGTVDEKYSGYKRHEMVPAVKKTRRIGFRTADV